MRKVFLEGTNLTAHFEASLELLSSTEKISEVTASKMRKPLHNRASFLLKTICFTKGPIKTKINFI